MYNGLAFNKKNLFLKFNNLRKSLMPKGKAKKNVITRLKEEKPYRMASEILFRAGLIYDKLEEMKLLNEACIKQFDLIKSELTLNCNRFILTSNIVQDYLYHFMPILNSLFILQDRIMPIFSKVLKISHNPPIQQKNIPAKKFKKKLYNFPESRNLSQIDPSLYPENSTISILLVGNEVIELLKGETKGDIFKIATRNINLRNKVVYKKEYWF